MADRTASLMSPRKLAQMKPAAPPTPAAWLDRMAADVGHQHVARMGEFALVLAAPVTGLRVAALESQLHLVAQSLPMLDFGLLEPQGLWARIRGRARRSGLAFRAQFEGIKTCVGPVAALIQELDRDRRAEATRVERALVDLQQEYRRIDHVIEEGTRWLQDMQGRLAPRRLAAAGNHQAPVPEMDQALGDAQRCKILQIRLQLLRNLRDAAPLVIDQTRVRSRQQASLLQTLQVLAARIKDWHDRLAPLAAYAAGGGGPALGFEGPVEAHDELIAGIRDALADCEQVQARHQTLARTLALLTAGNLAPG